MWTGHFKVKKNTYWNRLFYRIFNYPLKFTLFVIFRESDERSRQLRDLLDNNVKLKKRYVDRKITWPNIINILKKNHSYDRWKDIYSEVTEKLQSELFHMQTENAKLIAENQKLKLDLKRLGNKSKLQCDLNILKSTKTLEY